MRQVVRQPDAVQHASARDRGSILSVMAVLLGTGVLLGLIALTFDTGVVYAERASLGNGADAAAAGLAQRCAIGAPQCASAPAATTVADLIADANAPDAAADIQELCGRTAGWTVACQALTTQQPDCRPLAFPDGRVMPANQGFIRVRTSTLTDTGETAILPIFTGLLNGDAPDQGAITLFSCGQAAWGKVGRVASTFPAVLSLCGTYTVGGAPVILPEYAGAASVPSCTQTVFGPDGAPVTQTFTNVMRGFRWWDGACFAPVDLVAGSTVQSYDSPPTGMCGGTLYSILNAAVDSAAIHIVPIGGTITTVGSGSNRRYVIEVRSFVAIQLLAYRFQITRNSFVQYPNPAPITWPADCRQADDECLYVQAVRTTVSGGSISVDPNVPNMGVQAVELLP